MPTGKPVKAPKAMPPTKGGYSSQGKNGLQKFPQNPTPKQPPSTVKQKPDPAVTKGGPLTTKKMVNLSKKK